MKRVLSLDMETLSLDPRATIIQIGAVIFDRDGRDSFKSMHNSNPTFNVVVDWMGQQEFGRHLDKDTVQWWNEQNPKMADRLMNRPDMSYQKAVEQFDAWLRAYVEHRGIDECWVKGNRDGLWIETAFESLGLKFPIMYRNIKCIRSVATTLNVPFPIVPNATPHNALSDAIVQAIWVQDTFRYLDELKSSRLAA